MPPLSPVRIPRPRSLIPMTTRVPGSAYANIVNLSPPVGAVDTPDYIGELGKNITDSIAALKKNNSVDVSGLLANIKKQQSGWKPPIIPLGPITIAGSPGRPIPVKAPTGGVKLSGGVDQWIAQAYKILGIPLTAKALADERYMIQHESSGRANARNLTPAGIRAGYPEGLEQVTRGTFKSYALPGYNDPFNPIHNILASLRYRKSRYKTYDIGRYSGGY